MLGGGAQHRAEAAQHVRADRLALVALGEHAHQALAFVDVEVVEPEVDQHFFQLARAVQRPQQARLAGLQVDGCDLLAALAAFFRRGLGAVGGCRLRLPGLLRLLLHLAVAVHQLALRLVGRVQRAELVGEEGRQRQALGMQLFGDPRACAHARDAIQVARSGAERQPVQHVQRVGIGRVGVLRGQCGTPGHRGQGGGERAAARQHRSGRQGHRRLRKAVGGGAACLTAARRLMLTPGALLAGKVAVPGAKAERWLFNASGIARTSSLAQWANSGTCHLRQGAARRACSCDS